MAQQKLATGIAVVLMACGASAQPRDLAMDLGPAQEALAAGDYATAYDQYLYFAEKDDNALAQFTLALFYEQGWDRAANPAIACRWYERAANGGIPQAQMRLADCLLNGVAGPANPVAAATWYRRAADNGIPTALCELAKMYIAGNGVAKDPEEGLRLCRMAAEQGNARAMTQLGRFYLEGGEDIHDADEAFAWFSRAAQGNSAEGMYLLATMMRDRPGPGATVESARFWFESAAAEGYVPAYFPTAELYYLAEGDPETGLITPEDLAKLYMWLQVTIAGSNDATERADAKHMLDDVMQLIPANWLAELNRKVAHHIADGVAGQ
jgi:hypothetical protein